MDEKLLNRIISAAYGDSSLREQIKIRRIIKSDAEAEKIYNSYKRTALNVHKLPDIGTPPYLIENAKKRIGPKTYLSFDMLRPAAGFAVILIAAVIGFFSLLETRQQPAYSEAEIQTAEIQARESIAIVNRILNRTTSAIGNEILPDKVSKPVQKGLDIINNLLIGG
jgi:hypothetical protein